MLWNVKLTGKKPDAPGWVASDFWIAQVEAADAAKAAAAAAIVAPYYQTVESVAVATTDQAPPA